MKITRLETIWIDEQPNTTWLRIHTDDGLIGLGETFYVPRAVSAMIHDVFAALLLGRNPLDIESHWNNMMGTVNFFGFAGSEMRAISAVDVALWDIAGAVYRTADLQPAWRAQPRSHHDLQHLCQSRQASGFSSLAGRTADRGTGGGTANNPASRP